MHECYIAHLIMAWSKYSILSVMWFLTSTPLVIGIKTEAMDDPTHSYAMNALKREKEEKRRKSVAKDFCDSLIQTALSWQMEQCQRELAHCRWSALRWWMKFLRRHHHIHPTMKHPSQRIWILMGYQILWVQSQLRFWSLSEVSKCVRFTRSWMY